MYVQNLDIYYLKRYVFQTFKQIFLAIPDYKLLFIYYLLLFIALEAIVILLGALRTYFIVYFPKSIKS